MVAGPEIARVLKELESQLKDETNVDEKNEHHQQGLSTQKTFQSHVKNLVSTISEMGNPFEDDCPELLALDMRNCANASVVDTVYKVQEIGLRQYKKFVNTSSMKELCRFTIPFQRIPCHCSSASTRSKSPKRP